jgi:hypothetical protein
LSVNASILDLLPAFGLVSLFAIHTYIEKKKDWKRRLRADAKETPGNGKAKLLLLLIKYHAMKVYVGVEVQLYA